MSEISNGSTSQEPLPDSTEGGILLNSEDKTTSNINISSKDYRPPDCPDSDEKQDRDLIQELDPNTCSVPVSVISPETGLEGGDSSEDMKTDVSKSVAENTTNSSEATNKAEAPKSNHEARMENNSTNSEEDIPAMIASELLNYHMDMINLTEKFIQSISGDEHTRGNPNLDARSSKINLPHSGENSMKLKKNKTVNGRALEEESSNAQIDNVGFPENCHSSEDPNEGSELQPLDDRIVAKHLRILKLSEQLENTNITEEKLSNQEMKALGDDKEFQKNKSVISSFLNRKSETPQQAVNQTYLNALEYFQNLCDQQLSTMLGRKSEGYFQIRAQENKCLELGTEIQKMKGYLAGVKSDISELKMRCTRIKNSLKDIAHK